MSPLWVTCGSQVCGSEAVFLGGSCAAACGSTHTPMASMAEYCASEILRNHSLLRLLSTWPVRMNLIRLHMATHGYIIDLQDWFHMISRFHSIFIPKGAIEVLQFMAILTSLGPTVGTRGMAMAWINLAQLPQRSKRFLTILLLLFCLFFTLVYGFRGTVDISNIHQICVCVILCDHAWNMRPIHFSLHPLLPPGGKTRPVLSLMPVSVTRRRGHS